MRNKSNTRSVAVALVALLLSLLFVFAVAGDIYKEADDGIDESMGKPIARITYYLTEDGMVCTMIENLSDHDLTITFPDGIQPPVAEIGGYDGTSF